MARIAGVDLPRDKRVVIALDIYLWHRQSTAEKIIEETGVNPDTRVRDLTEDEVNNLREHIDKNYKVEGDLRREVALNIKRLIEIGCYRGIRHRRGSAGTRTTDENECAHPQRTSPHSSEQEEIMKGG